MKSILFAIAFAGLAPGAVVAQTPTATSQTTGKVTKIDASAGKITIDHGPIKSLDMPAMTMVFKAGDESMLKAVKPGDRIKFIADRVNGQMTVLKLEKVK